MWGQLEGKTKKEIAASVLSSTINQLADNQEIGLMAYGHRKKGDCDDVELMIDLENLSKEDLINAINAIKPLGKTPLARSAKMAIDNLSASKKKATIILVTDGIESCDGDICTVVSTAKKEGIDFKLHIVGFGLKEGETEQLKCAAQAGGGQYYSATDAEGLGDVLNEATAETVDAPDGNFSIYTVKNDEVIDSWVKAYKAGTKEAVDASRTYQDTAFIYLPPGKYDIHVQPLEGSDISGTTIQVEIKEGEIKHETVSFDAATLKVYASNNMEGWDAMVKVHDKATGKVAASARTYGKAKDLEIDPGVYDISFQALRIKGIATSFSIENIEVKAGEAKAVDHNFETGIAMIGVKTASGELIDATVNFTESDTNKRVAGNRTYTSEKNNPKEFILNPGKYSVKIVTLGKHKGNSTTIEVTVKAGETVEKIITF